VRRSALCRDECHHLNGSALSNVNQNPRAQRTTALTCGLMAEVAWGGALLVFSGTRDAAATEVFGRVGSIAIVAFAMILLAIVMVLAVLASRTSRRIRIFSVVIFAVTAAIVGVIAITSLMNVLGIGLLLAFGWILTVPVGLEVRRASSPRNR
jgi:hypothetical protein